MKFVIIILSAVAFAFARDFDMKLEENGETFTEQVKVDVAGKTEEIKVPKHANRAALDMLNDFNMGYSAMRVMADKACYISVLDEEEAPRQMDRSMRVSHAKFPTDSYMVQNDKFISLHEMTASEVGPKIAAHCAGYDMIFTMKFKKDSDAAKIIQSQPARMKRATTSVNIKKFTSCEQKGETVAQNCPEDKIDLKCKMLYGRSTTCVYRIICKQNMPYGWKCIGKHRFTLRFCCDFTCRP